MSEAEKKDNMFFVVLSVIYVIGIILILTV